MSVPDVAGDEEVAGAVEEPAPVGDAEEPEVVGGVDEPEVARTVEQPDTTAIKSIEKIVIIAILRILNIKTLLNNV